MTMIRNFLFLFVMTIMSLHTYGQSCPYKPTWFKTNIAKIIGEKKYNPMLFSKNSSQFLKETGEVKIKKPNAKNKPGDGFYNLCMGDTVTFKEKCWNVINPSSGDTIHGTVTYDLADIYPIYWPGGQLILDGYTEPNCAGKIGTCESSFKILFYSVGTYTFTELTNVNGVITTRNLTFFVEPCKICQSPYSYNGNGGFEYDTIINITSGWIEGFGMTYNVPDRFILENMETGEIIFNVSLGNDNKATGGLYGPISVIDGVIKKYPDVPDSIWWYKNATVPKWDGLNGGLVYFKAFACSTGKYRLRVISNDSNTAWELSLLCQKSEDYVQGTYYKDTTFCGSGVIDGKKFIKDTTYVQFVPTIHNCSNSIVWTIKVNEPNVIKYEYKTTCDSSQVGTVTHSSKNCEVTLITVTTYNGGPKKITHEKDSCGIKNQIVKIDTIQSKIGCDSIITIRIFNPISVLKTTVHEYTCVFGADTVYDTTHKSWKGCDSLVTTIVTGPKTPPVNVNLGIFHTCDKSKEGIFKDTVPNWKGCDSLYQVGNVIYDPPTSDTVYTKDCGSKYTIVSKMNTIPSSFGCDSIYRTTITVTDTTVIKNLGEVESCKKTGKDSLTLQSWTECDSIIYWTYKPLAIQYNNIKKDSCGITPGTLIEVIPYKNAEGCVNRIDTITTFVHASTVVDIGFKGFSCFPKPDTTWLQTKYLCDSLVISHTQMLVPTTQDSLIKICGNFAEYTTVIPKLSWQGCDSVYLRIKTVAIEPSYSKRSATFCNEGSINGNVFTKDTIYLQKSVTFQGCDSTIEWTIRVNHSKVYSLQTMEPVCNGSTETLNAQSGNTGYIWENGSTRPNLDVVVTEDKIYTVTITDIHGCKATADFEVTMKKKPSIKLYGKLDSCNHTKEVTIVVSDVGMLQIESRSNGKYEHYLQKGMNYNVSLPKDYLSEGMNYIRVHVDGECPMDTIIELELIDCAKDGVYIPNAFSPNDDHINDKFCVFANLEVVKSVSYQINDRWGELLFEVKNFTPNDESQNWWDGNFRNKKMNTGVYVYCATVNYIDGTKKIFKGDINLLR